MTRRVTAPESGDLEPVQGPLTYQEHKKLLTRDVVLVVKVVRLAPPGTSRKTQYFIKDMLWRTTRGQALHPYQRETLRDIRRRMQAAACRKAEETAE